MAELTPEELKKGDVKFVRRGQKVHVFRNGILRPVTNAEVLGLAVMGLGSGQEFGDVPPIHEQVMDRAIDAVRDEVPQHGV